MITVYSKNDCVQCKATYRALDAKGLKYEVYNVDESEQAMERAKLFGYKQAPVVVVGFNHPTMGGKHWSGFDPDNLAKL